MQNKFKDNKHKSLCKQICPNLASHIGSGFQNPITVVTQNSTCLTKFAAIFASHVGSGFQNPITVVPQNSTCLTKFAAFLASHS